METCDFHLFSDSQTNILLRITSNISKTNKQTNKSKNKNKNKKIIKIMGLHQSSRPPNFESLPYPEVGGRFEICSLKYREKDEHKHTRSNFSSLQRILEHWAKTVLGVVATPPPFGELRLTFC